MSSTCSYHFEQIVGYCQHCRTYACTVCLSEHLDHLARIVVLKNIADKVDAFYAQLVKTSGETTQQVLRLRGDIGICRENCMRYLQSLQEDLERHDKQHRMGSSVERYLGYLVLLKNKEYQKLQPDSFEQLNKLLQENRLNDLKNTHQKEVQKLFDVMKFTRTRLQYMSGNMSGNPALSPTVFNQAEKFYDARNYQAAADMFTLQLDQLMKKCILVPYSRYIDKHFDSMRRINDTQGTHKLALRLVAMQPTRSTNYFNLGVAQANYGRYMSALDSIYMARQMGMRTPQNYLVSADINQKIKNYSKAAEQYDKVLALDPKNQVALRKKQLLTQTQPRSNKERTAQLQNTKPSSPRVNVAALMAEADSYEKASSFDKAIQIYNHLIQCMPGQSIPYYNKSRCQYMLKKFPQAMNSIDQALSISPLHSHYYQLKSMIMGEAKYPADSILQVIQRGLKIQPTHPSLLLQKGSILYSIQSYDQALICYDILLQKQTNNPQLLFYKSLTLQQLGRYQQGIAAIQAALKLSHDTKYVQTKTRLSSKRQKLQGKPQSPSIIQGFPTKS